MLAKRPKAQKTELVHDPLIRSFIVVLCIQQGIQFGIFASYSLPIGFFQSYAAPFISISMGFHCFIFFMLYLFRGDFVIEPSGRKLEHINWANTITLFRLSTMPTILFVILASKDYAIRFELVALVALVFATDFLDGYVSRTFKEMTRAGKMLDSSSDYTLLFVISLVFHYFHIIPLWFMWLLILRLAGQFAMVGIVLAVKKRVTPKTSFFGKATIASTMMLYAFELLRFVADIPPTVYNMLELIVGIIVGLSILDKILIMRRDLIAPAQDSSGPGRLNSIADGEIHGTD